MSMLAGMVIGSMLASSSAKGTDSAPISPPTMCVLAMSFDEYNKCRFPEIFDQLRGGNGYHYCNHLDRDADRDTRDSCNPNWRAGVEWRGILRSRGVKPL